MTKRIFLPLGIRFSREDVGKAGGLQVKNFVRCAIGEVEAPTETAGEVEAPSETYLIS